MTKKNLLLVLMLVTMLPMSKVVASPILLDLEIQIEDPSEDNGHHRSPVDAPVFYLDGYTLIASSNTVGSTVELKDESGIVVFSTYIYIEGDINLPSYLCGIYTIEVTRDGITFQGEIELE